VEDQTNSGQGQAAGHDFILEKIESTEKKRGKQGSAAFANGAERGPVLPSIGHGETVTFENLLQSRKTSESRSLEAVPFPGLGKKKKNTMGATGGLTEKAPGGGKTIGERKSKNRIRWYVILGNNQPVTGIFKTCGQTKARGGAQKINPRVGCIKKKVNNLSLTKGKRPA